MGRKRKTHRNLPQRVYVHRSNYRYVPKIGKPVILAKVGDYSGMLRRLAEIVSDRPPLNSLAVVMDRYQLEVLPEKGDQTQYEQLRQLKTLRSVFGHMQPCEIRQTHAYEYLQKRSESAPTAARRELELLSHVCTMAASWGAISSNPLLGMRKPKNLPRRRYVTDEEFQHVWNLASPMVRCVMDLGLLTSLRRGDIFSLERRNIKDDGLLVRPSKTENSTGVEILIEWTPTFRETIDRALSLPPRFRQSIVCNRKGKPYTKNGFDSVWGRLMDKATDESKDFYIDRFQFRDLRRKSASDESDESVAQKRLGHANLEITNRVYRVKPNRVRPLR